MKSKSLAQILIPIVCTVLLWIVLAILSFLLASVCYLLAHSPLAGDINYKVFEVLENISNFLLVNIFKWEDELGNVDKSAVFFWVINSLFIVFVELWATSEIEDEESKYK
nr:hypothetical protein [uncultured Bacteroides sp.]